MVIFSLTIGRKRNYIAQDQKLTVPPPDLQDFNAHPRMVGWFDPPTLLDIARQAVVSAVFGQDADRRLIQTSLTMPTNPNL